MKNVEVLLNIYIYKKYGYEEYVEEKHIYANA